MSHQVFAIKTRPQNFDQVKGQDVVISALRHALDKNKLHHAYLFTGTRGVGKTTIARILAKSLNCNNGVSSSPCNDCENCLAIMQGKFPDLIEIDAASKTKVEDTRALLDTVIYSPTQGRYKVYLIDEVHMLSSHSFNALLKTLEEPPSHVKFLLATTDPEKIPATILSRCLQFTLRWVEPEILVNHLEQILSGENITYDLAALTIIADAANGSVRDALSLLEQALAQGGGEINAQLVRDMLGRISGQEIIALLNAIVAQNADAVITQVHDLVVTGADLSQVLVQLIYTLHQVALLQQAQAVVRVTDMEFKNELTKLASMISPQDLQIYYQIALLAKRDLPYTPQPRLALEMALLRMLNFVPVDDSQSVSTKIAQESKGSQDSAPSPRLTKPSTHSAVASVNNTVAVKKTKPVASQASKMSEQQQSSIQTDNSGITKANWHQWITRLGLTGISLQLVKNTEFVSLAAQKMYLKLDARISALVNQKRLNDIEVKLQQALGKKIQLIVEQQAIKNDTHTAVDSLHVREQSEKQEKQAALVDKIKNDPHIDSIMKTFNGELKLDSVELTDS